MPPVECLHGIVCPSDSFGTTGPRRLHSVTSQITPLVASSQPRQQSSGSQVSARLSQAYAKALQQREDGSGAASQRVSAVNLPRRVQPAHEESALGVIPRVSPLDSQLRQLQQLGVPKNTKQNNEVSWSYWQRFCAQQSVSPRRHDMRANIGIDINLHRLEQQLQLRFLVWLPQHMSGRTLDAAGQRKPQAAERDPALVQCAPDREAIRLSYGSRDFFKSHVS